MKVFTDVDSKYDIMEPGSVLVKEKDGWWSFRLDKEIGWEILASGEATDRFFEHIIPLITKEEAPPPVVEKEVFRHIPNDRGERCIHSFNDTLRALAAAAGTLPEGIK